jgi:hypothetical protein
MKNTPFTVDEAIDIAEDFEDLIDTDFSINKALIYLVENVMICPFKEDDKKLFVSNYHYSKDKDGALDFYKGKDYDVIVLAYDVDDESSFTYIDIRTFANQKGIKYDFP